MPHADSFLACGAAAPFPGCLEGFSRNLRTPHRESLGLGAAGALESHWWCWVGHAACARGHTAGTCWSTPHPFPSLLVPPVF